MAQQMTTDDGNEDHIQHPKIYAKDSMDRFGDDMYGLILSYLSLEDRFRLECVSKQFQRTVFGSVVFIDINNQFNNKSETCFKAMIEMLAKKCPNIQTIDFREMFIECEEHIPEVLRLLRDNCLNLREVYCSSWEYTTQLYQQFGPLVTRIDCDALSDTVVDTTSGQLLANNLKTFEFYCYYIEDRQLFTAFVAHNQCLKSLGIKYIYDDLNDTLPELAVQLSRLTQLRRLSLGFRIKGSQHSFNDYLRTIGVNCKQLKRLSFSLHSKKSEYNLKTLDSLAYFRRLKRLDLTLYVTVDEISLDVLRECRRLTHLDIYLTKMNANVFKIIRENCPQLQYLCIQNMNSIIDTEYLDQISRLPALQMFVIHCKRSGSLRDNDFWDLLSRSPKLKTIEIHVKNVKKFYSK
ncbi:unnamed protein product [Medioppia subpectinata]|uniref:F-box domain-containing protein n=1 Tax=Medioppia subpectinata TaxID=1979941 RepID=A0A7R9KKA7_9ACAR|nr:unnamed protein product [Medioppia subpectinata]CAG2103937.1 unnamed protein product [Medioppia subpectinata]